MNWEERNRREAEWLAGLKAGDPVIVCRSHIGGTGYEESSVVRTTPTLVVVGNNRFNKKRGTCGGNTWGGGLSIAEPTSELLEVIREQSRRAVAKTAIFKANLGNSNVLRSMPIDQLERIAAACELDPNPED